METASAAHAAPDAVPPETIARLEDMVKELERENGPYDPQLGEQLRSLGLAYRANGDYAEAGVALSRALHINRINTGLHSLDQLETLKSLIDVYIAGENWDALDQAYQQLLWIHRRNFDAGDEELLQVTDLVGRWKIRAYLEHLLSAPRRVTIAEAEDLYGRSIELLEERYGEDDPRLIDALYGRVLTNYQLLVEVANTPLSAYDRTPAFSQPAARLVTQCINTPRGPVCRTISVPNPTYLDEFRSAQQEKELDMMKHVSTITRALEQIVEIHEANPDLPVESRAVALVHLGDWHMLKGREGTGIGKYQEAYRLLAAAGGRESLIQELFGAPKTLPSLRLSVPSVDEQLEAASAQAPYVVVAAEVSDRGRARKIRIVEESDPGNKGALRAAREKIKGSTFRPRLVDGEPVATEDFRIRVTAAP
jgi:tetratricopeptide (TPR) repeat protein